MFIKLLLVIVMMTSVLPLTSTADTRCFSDVKVTAYTLTPEEGWGDGTIGAWGDKLEHHIPTIAVSRDWLGKGVGHGSWLTINGKRHQVLDKMGARWRKKIDIVKPSKVAAREWGVKNATVCIALIPTDVVGSTKLARRIKWVKPKKGLSAERRKK
jgi:3D (Asp-Asp-Asp) domain-containing protein